MLPVVLALLAAQPLSSYVFPHGGLVTLQGPLSPDARARIEALLQEEQRREHAAECLAGPSED